MAKWGQKVDRRDPSKPGWRRDPERPGVDRYWSGSEWDDTIAPRPTPEPVWKGARVIALGILIAAAVIFFVWQAQQPSDLECSTQRLEVLTGKRLAVEAACVGR